VTLEARVAQRVQRGVRWLNLHYPGWPRRIHLKTFDFTNPCQCVVGFVCRPPRGSRDRDGHALDGFDVAVAKLGRPRVCALGFDWGLEPGVGVEAERDALARAWQVAIRVAREGLRGRA
jgi:hypothetical protein